MDVTPEFERFLLALRTLNATERKIALDTLYRMEEDPDDD